jgi:hypothetical protein
MAEAVELKGPAFKTMFPKFKFSSTTLEQTDKYELDDMCIRDKSKHIFNAKRNK